MEKYARQALSEGIKSADDLHVTDDCELLRVLNLHYNRSNHIAVSFSFSINQFKDVDRKQIFFNFLNHLKTCYFCY